MTFEMISIRSEQGDESDQEPDGAKSALDYLFCEKFLNVAGAAERHPQLGPGVATLPGGGVADLQSVRIGGYVTSLEPNRERNSAIFSTPR